MTQIGFTDYGHKRRNEAIKLKRMGSIQSSKEEKIGRRVDIDNKKTKKKRAEEKKTCFDMWKFLQSIQERASERVGEWSENTFNK